MCLVPWDIFNLFQSLKTGMEKLVMSHSTQLYETDD